MTRRLVIVVRADPVICGHAGEARNLAEAALDRGFTEVRILTWPMERLEQTGLPLKPIDRVLPYREGIVVERPEPVGDYKVPDGRWLAGLTGRLVELFTDGVPTVCLSLYLSPHAVAVADALRVAEATGLPMDVVTAAEAVGSDVTNVVRSCVADGRFGAAAHVLASYLAHDVVLAVSQYTRDVVVAAADEVDARFGTDFAGQLRDRVEVSYPAIDVGAYLALDPATTEFVLARRGLLPGGYVLYLSRLMPAKGVDELIAGYAASAVADRMPLVIAGRGPDATRLAGVAAASGAGDRILFLDDVDDAEKPHLMAGSAAFALPSKPLPEFTETFGIALVETLLAGGGPVITTITGGITEAVGENALVVPAGESAPITEALDRAVLGMSDDERTHLAQRGRMHALQFDRGRVLDGILRQVDAVRFQRAAAYGTTAGHDGRAASGGTVRPMRRVG